MRLTWKDLQQTKGQGARIVAAFQAMLPMLSPILRPVLRLGFIQRWTNQSLGGRVGSITYHAKRGEHRQAADLAITCIKEYWDQKPGTWAPVGHDFWWLFVRLAVENLEACGDQEGSDRVIEWANAETNRADNYQAAMAYYAFAHAMYRRKDFAATLRYARIAAEADPTWATPNFFLGWYALVFGEGDATEQLSQAVRKDAKVLTSIEADEVIKRHPHIIAKLRKIANEVDTSGIEE